MIRSTLISLLLAGAIFAAEPTFEVASIKPSPPPNPAAMMSGAMKIGMKVDGARVDIGFFTVEQLIAAAYGVKPYQISGPSSINETRFDIQATLPEGARDEQVPAMLRALLAERFGLKVHRENRDLPIYALVEARGGAKLKPAEKQAADAPSLPAEGEQPQKGVLAFGMGDNRVAVRPNPEGRGATITTSKAGPAKFSMSPDGNMQMEFGSIEMAAFAEMLSRFVDRPVFDQTGIKGAYQISLEIALDDLKAMARSAGLGMGMGMGMGRGTAEAPPPGASDPTGGSIFTALGKLGLKLDPRKDPIETIVVEHVEKTPTEN
jgi:uncharacterized protein (TIGR03435 family)